MNYEDIYQKCYRIRCFEKKVEKEFSAGNMRGTTHGCVGQEIIPVCAMEYVNHEYDHITGTHRCHGQVLAYTCDAYKLACEMMGRKDGFVHGLGGSQHIRVYNYLTNGITGGMVSVGTGIAMAKKKVKAKGIVLSFLGDGGFNEGYVQESFNLASSYDLPILYLCENNKYAMSTRTDNYSAGDFKNRIEALNMRYIVAGTDEPEGLFSKIGQAYEYVNDSGKPCFCDVHTARLCGHSKSDPMDYKDKEEICYEREQDPLLWLESKISPDKINLVKTMVDKEIEDAFYRAMECNEINGEDFIRWEY